MLEGIYVRETLTGGVSIEGEMGRIPSSMGRFYFGSTKKLHCTLEFLMFYPKNFNQGFHGTTICFILGSANVRIDKERFAFLKWGSKAFHNMLVVPPGSGIVHAFQLFDIMSHRDVCGLNEAAEGARISGASRIVGVDLNANRFELEIWGD